VSTGKTSFPGNGVGEGMGVSVGGIGEGVIVAVGGTGEDVRVGTSEAVGIMAGSAVQLVTRTISRINVIRCFMMSPHWRILKTYIFEFSGGGEDCSSPH